MIRIPCGNAHELVPSLDVRTYQQQCAVEEIVCRKEFDFATNNPFAYPTRSRETFSFLWYDVEGKLRHSRVTAAGRIKEV